MKTRLLGVLMVGTLFLGVGLYASASNMVDPAPPSTTQAAKATLSWSPETPVNFLAHGGRSNIVISPAKTNIDVARGSVVQIPITVTHMIGANPLPVVTVQGIGVVNRFIPAAFVNQTTPQERVNIVESGGTIPGELDLNSTIAFSPNPIILNAGDVKVVTLTISIPKDWPDAAVGQDIWYALNFQPLEHYDLPDFQLTQAGIQLHVVS